MACPYCYARAMYDRFKWDKTIRFVREELTQWSKAKAGDRIFVGSTIELFGDWIADGWIKAILNQVKLHPNLTFQFLTKCPWNLPLWGKWPDNAWVGVTVIDNLSAMKAYPLADVQASIRFISFEPLLEHIYAKESMGRAIAKAQAEKLVEWLKQNASSIDPILGFRLPYELWIALRQEVLRKK